MRHLFVPACVCIVTWTGATASDHKLAPEDLSGFSVVEKKSGASEQGPEIVPIAEDKPALPDGGEIRQSAVSDVPIQIPEQTDVEPQLTPKAIPLPPVAKPVVHRSRQEVCDTLAKSAETNNLPLPFFIRLLFQESGFRPHAKSAATACACGAAGRWRRRSPAPACSSARSAGRLYGDCSTLALDLDHRFNRAARPAGATGVTTDPGPQQ